MPNFFLVNERTIPIIILVDSKEEPPYEIKGRVTPVVGIIFNDTQIFINAWIKKRISKPELASKEKKLSILLVR